MSQYNNDFTDSDTIPDRVPPVNTFHEMPPGYDEWLDRHDMTSEEIDAACAAEAARKCVELPTLSPITAQVRQLDPRVWGKAVCNG